MSNLNDLLSSIQNDPQGAVNNFMTNGSVSGTTDVTPTISTSLLNNYNNMITAMTNNAICDASCQYDASLNALYQAMKNAELNEKNAPFEYEQAEEAYYAFLGESMPNDFQEQKYLEKYNVLMEEYKQKFDESLYKDRQLNENYNTMYTNTNNSYDLYLNNMTVNETLRQQFNITASNIFTNDRKSMYENQGLETIQFHGKMLFYLHIIFVVLFILAIFYFKTSLSIYNKILYIILIILQPLIARLIMFIFNKLYNGIQKLLPKNIYLTL